MRARLLALALATTVVVAGLLVPTSVAHAGDRSFWIPPVIAPAPWDRPIPYKVAQHPVRHHMHGTTKRGAR